VVAATGLTLVTGGLGACVLAAVIGVVVGIAMSKTGADKGLSKICEDIGNALFPPTVQATILTGSTDTLINSIPAARAAGSVPSHLEPSGTPQSEEPQEEPGYLDMAQGFFFPDVAPDRRQPGSRCDPQAAGFGDVHEAPADAATVPR